MPISTYPIIGKTNSSKFDNENTILTFKFKDKEGKEYTSWLDKTEWDFLQNFRNKKQHIIKYFGYNRACGLGEPITIDEWKEFNEYYNKTKID